MSKIKLSKSVTVSNAVNGKYFELYQKLTDDCYRILNNFVRGEQENLHNVIPVKSIQIAEASLIEMGRSYIHNYEIEDEKIIGRGNRKINIELFKVELIKVDSSFKNCVFMLHFISQELYFKAFVGNSVIISLKDIGTNTIMVDFDNKEVSVESIDTNENWNTTAI